MDLKTGRELLVAKNSDIATAQGLVQYAKGLMTKFRRNWEPPSASISPTPFNTWLDELLFVGYKLSICLNNNPKGFYAADLCPPFIALFTFAAAQLNTLCSISKYIEDTISNLVCPNIVLPYFISIHKTKAVVLLFNALSNKISDGVLLNICAYLIQHDTIVDQVIPYLEKLEEKFPSRVANLRAAIAISHISYKETQEKCTEALSILQKALEKDKDNAQLLYNSAILSIKKHDKDSAFAFIKKALLVDNRDPRILLLIIRILRSNCMYEQALDIATKSPNLLDRWEKHIVVEAMFASAENGDMGLMESLFQRLVKDWRNDCGALSSAVRLNLMLGKVAAASDVFQSWAVFDQQSADFFFCYAMLSVNAQDFGEAEKSLTFAVEAAPERAEFHAALANVLERRGKHEMAVERARFATEVDPDSVHACLALAAVEGDGATKAVEAARELRRNTVSLENLGLMYAPYDPDVRFDW